MGDSSASITSPHHHSHQTVVNRLRERIGQYRRHHQTCQDKYERLLPLRQKQNRQDAFLLHQRAVESGRTNRISNMKTKQQDPGSKASKQDQPPNGLEKSASSASAILQQKILKRKLGSSLNSINQTTGHSLEANEQTDCLSKYQRGLIHDDVHSMVSERQINTQSAQQGERFAPHDQHQHSELRSHQLATENVSNSCQSPLISNSVDHGRVDAFQSNRIASPSSNSYQSAELKQESQVTVSCEGHASNSNNLHETMSASEPLAHNSVELRATNSLSFSKRKNGSQHLKEQLDDFERILKNYQNSEGTKRTNNGQSSGLESQRQQPKQLQTPQLKQSDPMSRSPSQEQVNDRNAHVSANNSLQSAPYRQSGTIHLQEMARQSAQLAQANKVRSPQRINESQQQRMGFSHLQQQLQLERLKQAANQSVQQQQQNCVVSQPQQATGLPSYFHSPFSQNQYRPGFEDQNQNSTRVSSSYSAAHYQRTLQAQQTGQQGLYGFSGQQQVMQKLTHHNMQEKSQIYAQQHNRQMVMQQQQQGPLAGFDAVPQARPMPVQELSSMPYSVSMRVSNQSSPVYQRQHSMPHMTSNAYQQQNFYNQQPATYKSKEQTTPILQQAKQQVPPYNNHQQRRHSFPFNRSLSQPTDNFSTGMQDAYSLVSHVNPQSRGPAFMQQNVLEIRHSVPQSSIPTQNKHDFNGARPMHTPSSYTNIAGRNMLQSTPNQTASKNHYSLSQMSSSQTTRNFPVDNNNDYNRIQSDNSFGSYQAPDAPVTSSSSPFVPFSSTPTLEKAPSFTSLLSQANVGELGSLLDQASTNPGNLETTFSGSIPNLDLLDGILGQN